MGVGNDCYIAPNDTEDKLLVLTVTEPETGNIIGGLWGSTIHDHPLPQKNEAVSRWKIIHDPEGLISKPFVKPARLEAMGREPRASAAAIYRLLLSEHHETTANTTMAKRFRHYQ